MWWINISTKQINRFIAMVVAFTMVFTMGLGTPLAIAENGGTESVITNIASLNDDVAVQHLPVGASESDIVFPGTIGATLETYKDVLVEVIPEVEEIVEEATEAEEPVVEEVEDQAEDVVDAESQNETQENIEGEAVTEEALEEVTGEASENPVVTENPEVPEAAEIPEATEITEAAAEATPVETAPAETATVESAPVVESAPAPEPVSEPEPANPVAFIIDTLFPAITVKAAEAGVFAEVAAATEEAISGGTEEVPEAQPTYVVETITTSADITLTDITWTLDPAMSTAPAFDSNIEGATYVYTANIPTEYAINASIPTITVIIGEAAEEADFEQSTVVDGVVITVKADKGVFPEGATLTARRATEEEKDTYDNAVEELEGALPVVSSYVFDIKVLDSEGNEIQPDTTKGQVYVSFTLEEAANEELDVNVYHIPDSENGATEAEKLEADINGTTVEAETDSFSIYGITTTATNDVMENDGYPYLVSQGDSSAKLAVKVQDGKETTSSYQWVMKTNDEWVAITGATSREIVLSGDNLVNTAWYACVVNGFDSKPVQMLQAGKGEWTWAWDYSYSWYVSNGQMAYSVDGSGFDIRGKYVKPDGSKYMLNTSYNSSAWRIQKQSGSITDLCFKFDEGDASSVIISAYLDGCNGISFGTDTMLGDDDFDYADNAALESSFNSDNSLKQIAMIGAKSSKEGDYSGSDPAFVITPITRTGLKYWLGSYYQTWSHFSFNTSKSGYEEKLTTQIVKENGNTPVVVKVNNEDSAMSMSWTGSNIGLVQFKFGVGTVDATGAVGGNINYVQGMIEGLDPGTTYTVEYDDKSIELTANEKGKIPFAGTGYDFTGKTITIKHGNDAASQLQIAARPVANEVNSTGTKDDGDAAKPKDVGRDTIVTTNTSITINVGENGQEYCVYDENGEAKSEWVKLNAGQSHTFTGLGENTKYYIKARVSATNSSPASLPSDGVEATTKGTVEVVASNVNTTYDGDNHTYPITVNPTDATVTYSLDENTDYAATIPNIKNAGDYKVYYKAAKTGYRTAYGSFTVHVTPQYKEQVDFDEVIDISSEACNNVTISLAPYLNGIVDGDYVAVVGAGWLSTSQKNIADYTNMTTSLSLEDKTLTYNVGDSQAGFAGYLYLYIENPNYSPYYITIPVVTAEPIVVVEPSKDDTTIIYDGREHSYPVSTDDETAVVKYSTTPDGEYTTDIPSFATPGTHTVYYSIERPGKNPKLGSYEMTIYPKPSVVSSTITYDGREHAFPAYTNDEDAEITYSLSKDGIYTSEAPMFKDAGDYVVYYKLQKPGQQEVYGSYVIHINKPVVVKEESSGSGSVLPTVVIPTKKVEEEKKLEEENKYEPDTTIIENLIPEVVKEKIEEIKTENETIVDENAIDKGKIVDNDDIWKDMTDDTKLKLLEKLEEKGGEVVRFADMSTLVDASLAELKAEQAENKTKEDEDKDKVPVSEKPVALVMGEGAVVVSLELADNSKANAGLADAKAVAKSILTEEQYAAVAAGSILEIKVELTPLEEEAIPELDRQVIDDGVTEYAEQIPNLAMADYIDISMFMRIDDNDWNQLTEVDPIDIVIDIPETHKGLSDTYYIMRAHEGVSTLLEDKDGDSDTITISTGQFSTYALMYDEPQVAVKADFTASMAACKLCHKCPTLFGICYYVWLAIVAAAGISLVLYKSAKKQTEE